ncbi:MAG: 2-amino-4-hydroxy-6-hydroxymethyldihydropteridine diphosphokinase [bacterium]
MGFVFIGFGSNEGDREKYIKKALDEFRQGYLVLCNCSSIYLTEGVDSKSNAKEFLNMVASFETILSPIEVLLLCQQIEKSLGRTQSNNSSRSIDLDLLFYGNLIVCEDGLILPHPLAHRRRFVIVPMCEIAPYFIHPVINITMIELNEKLPTNIGYVKKFKEIPLYD